MKNKGFTLIELLAVITIMGILMLVAIPAVSRTIENSRRDTFADIAHNYINAVRNAVLADNIECNIAPSGSTTAQYVNASATPDGTYYLTIDTLNQATAMGDLMESGGKSPFGNAEMVGYVKWVKGKADSGNSSAGNSSTENQGNKDQKSATKYYMVLTDSGKHGFDTELEETAIKRAKISTQTKDKDITKPKESAIECKVA